MTRIFLSSAIRRTPKNDKGEPLPELAPALGPVGAATVHIYNLAKL